MQEEKMQKGWLEESERHLGANIKKEKEPYRKIKTSAIIQCSLSLQPQET